MYIPLYLWGWWDEGQRRNEEIIWGYIKRKNEEGILILWELVRGEEGQKNQVRINIGCRNYEGRRKLENVESQENVQVVNSLRIQKGSGFGCVCSCSHCLVFLTLFFT